MITNPTPESRSFVRTAQAIQPLYAADFHGYTGVLQVEPCGPPHGDQLRVRPVHPAQLRARAQGRGRRRRPPNDPGQHLLQHRHRAVVPDNTGPDTAHIKIPYRDTPAGWDDFPPIFTAQYAAYYGAATSTVELPKGRTGANGAADARPTPSSTRAVAHADHDEHGRLHGQPTNAREMLANQVEVFQRGVAGAAQGPADRRRTSPPSPAPTSGSRCGTWSTTRSR